MSMAPHAQYLRAASRWAAFELIDTMIKDGLWGRLHGYHMGNTAENVREAVPDHRSQAG